MSLIELVTEYTTSDDLRRQYAQEPVKVLADYGVKGTLLKLLQSKGLAAAVAAEVASLAIGGGVHPLGWGIPAMKISGFSPDAVTTGVEFDLAISGEEFTKDTLAAVAPADDPETIIAASQTRFVSSRKIVGKFTVDEADDYLVGAFVPATKGDLPRGAWFDLGATLTVSQDGPLAKPSKKALRGKKPGKTPRNKSNRKPTSRRR